MKNIIVGIGEALWDILPEGKKMGGATANFAYHASQFGLESRAVSAVGNDDLGKEIIDSLTKKELKYIIEQVPFPTGTVLVELDEKGIPCYQIKENVAWDHIAYTPQLEELAKNTKAVCFGSLAQRSPISRSTINRFLDQMPDGDGQYKVFDINLRQNFYTKEIISNSMNKCNILKINDEELIIITNLFNLPSQTQEESCKTLLSKFNLKIVILTCGADCSYVFTPQTTSHIKTPKVNAIDTVGAGDSFTATFISSLIKNKPIPEAHKRAVEVSAYVCTQKGAMPEIPENFKW